MYNLHRISKLSYLWIIWWKHSVIIIITNDFNSLKISSSRSAIIADFRSQVIRSKGSFNDCVSTHLTDTVTFFFHSMFSYLRHHPQPPSTSNPIPSSPWACVEHWSPAAVRCGRKISRRRSSLRQFQGASRSDGIANARECGVTSLTALQRGKTTSPTHFDHLPSESSALARGSGRSMDPWAPYLFSVVYYTRIPATTPV